MLSHGAQNRHTAKKKLQGSFLRAEDESYNQWWADCLQTNRGGHTIRNKQGWEQCSQYTGVGTWLTIKQGWAHCLQTNRGGHNIRKNRGGHIGALPNL